MQPRVIGLDLSLAATGIARVDGSLDIITTGPGDHLGDQRDRLRHITDEVIARTKAGLFEGPHLAVIEGPSYNSRGAGTWDRAGLWWLVVDRLFHECVPVAVVPPAALKRYATGRGNATKADMRLALYQREHRDVRDDNMVDARWLALMGLDWLGFSPILLPKTHRDAMTKIDWPEVA
ncbi:hypothetical protein [Actinomadura rugatobispora]|uniref:Holliday junction resolvase RuvC n=1 Tax=Actinomadura rugatobispora TaxID=1994 RepID=A0ABW0ZTR5_9ACTN|nr:hypothetical protein GCM10010200_036040 [Actinomadura rugatobispora]